MLPCCVTWGVCCEHHGFWQPETKSCRDHLNLHMPVAMYHMSLAATTQWQRVSVATDVSDWLLLQANHPTCGVNGPYSGLLLTSAKQHLLFLVNSPETPSSAYLLSGLSNSCHHACEIHPVCNIQQCCPGCAFHTVNARAATCHGNLVVSLGLRLCVTRDEAGSFAPAAKRRPTISEWPQRRASIRGLSLRPSFCSVTLGVCNNHSTTSTRSCRHACSCKCHAFQLQFLCNVMQHHCTHCIGTKRSNAPCMCSKSWHADAVKVAGVCFNLQTQHC